MAGYITYWSKEHVRALEKAGDSGPLSVIYGGPHTKMPSIASLKPGDIIYPAAIRDGTLCAMARMEVETVEPALDYLMREVGRPAGAVVPRGMALERTGRGAENLLDGGELDFTHSVFALSDGTWLEKNGDLPGDLKKVYTRSHYHDKPHKCHQEPHTCCAELAASGTGSFIRPRPLPVECLPDLRFGQSKSKEKPLRLNKDGGPVTSSLSGFVRKMSGETWALFEGLFSEEDAV